MPFGISLTSSVKFVFFFLVHVLVPSDCYFHGALSTTFALCTSCNHSNKDCVTVCQLKTVLVSLHFWT